MAPCKNKRCLYPQVCASLKPDHSRQINLLKSLRNIKDVKKNICCFPESAMIYLRPIRSIVQVICRSWSKHHISGPVEGRHPNMRHLVSLKLMGKPQAKSLTIFKTAFLIKLITGHEPQSKLQVSYPSAARDCSTKQFSEHFVTKIAVSQQKIRAETNFLTYYVYRRPSRMHREDMARNLNLSPVEELKINPRARCRFLRRFLQLIRA